MVKTDVRHTAGLLRTLVERQVRVLSKRSLIAAIWPGIVPFFLLGLYLFVFKTVFKVPILRYGEFLLAGLIPWVLLAQGLTQGVSSLAGEGNLVRRARFPYELLPISAVGALSAYFVVDLLIFLVYLGARGQLAYRLVPLLPLYTAELVLFVMALAMVLSLIDVYYRDLRGLIGNVLLFWFFLVPVVYRPNMLPDRLLFLRSLDPMNMLIGEFRDVLYYGHISRPMHIPVVFVCCIAVFGASLALFRRMTPSLPKDI